MAWTNSSLVDYTLISPNKYVGRKDYNGKAITKLDYIAIHCVVGQVTVERLGQIFANPSRYASSNYGVGLDGKIGQYVYEKDTSWCTSSCVDTKTQPGCDNHGISIEVASDSYAPYAVTDKAYKATIKLVVDICKRNGITKVTWIADKAKNLAYRPAKGEVLLTAHRFRAAKNCPGDYLFTRFADIAKKANAELSKAASKTTTSKPKTSASAPKTTTSTTASTGKTSSTKTTSSKKAVSMVATRFDARFNKLFYVIAKDGLHLRQGCGTSTKSLKVLKYGTPVRCYGYYTPDDAGYKWMYVVADGKTGFVCSLYVNI